jgi:uncharacterized membrane protein
MEKLKAVWKDIVESLWFRPGLITVACGVLAMALLRYDGELKDLTGLDATEVWWLFGGSASGAQSVLEAIAGSIMTVTGVVFSVTIVALQLASNQFTPRVLRHFMADRSNQTVLGVFIGTFTYALLVLRTIRGDETDEAFVPAIAVTVGVLLTLTAMGFLIHFINHVARSMQASMIIEAVTDTGLGILRDMYPDELHQWSAPPGDAPADVLPPAHDAYEVRASTAGYVQAVEQAALRQFASRYDLLIAVEVPIGSYVLPGQPVLRVWPGTGVTVERERLLSRALVVGIERTPHQDLMHAVTELMDIAARGLSPAMNDPTTAINVIHRAGQLLLDMAWRECGPIMERDDKDRVCVVMKRPSLEDVTGMAFNQVRFYGASNASVAIAMMDTLAELAALSPDHAREAFTEHLHAVIASAREKMTDPADRPRLEKAVARAVARSQAISPRQRPQQD